MNSRTIFQQENVFAENISGNKERANNKSENICKNGQLPFTAVAAYGQQWARIAGLVSTEDGFERDKQCYCYLKLLLPNKHNTANTVWQVKCNIF